MAQRRMPVPGRCGTRTEIRIRIRTRTKIRIKVFHKMLAYGYEDD